MTTLVVGDGQYKTIGAALDVAAEGDVIEVSDGIYREMVRINKAVKIIATGGGRPIIDGGWKGETVDGNPALLAINAAGVTVRGLRLENSPGKGIGISASDVTIQDCHVRNTRMDGIVANGLTVKGLRNITVEDSSFVGLSQKMGGDKSDQAAGSSFVIVYVLDSIFRRNIIGDGFKEGFNIDKNTRGCLWEGNILFDTNHAGCYFNHCQDNIVRKNLFLHTNPEKYRGARGVFPAAVVFGDERAAESRNVAKSSGNQFVNNVVVGWGRLLEVRNGTNYDTQLLNTVIEGNTFIAGRETVEGINIAANLYGRAHANSRVANNAIWFAGAKEGADIGTMGAGGKVEFNCNAWSVQPPRSMCGAGDVYGELGLVNPGVMLNRIEKPPFTDYADGNYRPRADSPLVTPLIGALMPEEAFPPPDPTPTMDELVTALEGHRKTLAGAGLVVTDALNEVDELIALLKSE
jgi:hypothetical protein